MAILFTCLSHKDSCREGEKAWDRYRCSDEILNCDVEWPTGPEKEFQRMCRDHMKKSLLLVAEKDLREESYIIKGYCFLGTSTAHYAVC